MNIARREAVSSNGHATAGTHQNVLGVAMSVPRLGFMDNFFCIYQCLQTLDFYVPLLKFTGAYWGQCLTRTINSLIRDKDPALIMTVDYDTIFKPEIVGEMLAILRDNPHIDAIAPIEMHRMEPRPLFCIKAQNNGGFRAEVEDTFFDGPVSQIHTAHMGCMIFRVDSLKKVEKPWFWSKPDPNGEWEDGRIDDDTWFWEQWAKAGNTLYSSNRHVVGHAELMLRWPTAPDPAKGIEAFDFLDRHPSEFWTKGHPEGVWK
jgi:hypothetical protein